MYRGVTRVALALLAAALIASACGGGATTASGAQVTVTLTDNSIVLDSPSLAPGKVTFNVRNSGKVVHEMIVGRVPINGPLSNGKMSEQTSVGEVSELDPGRSGHVTLNLKPGKYVLYCNIAGHYQAGQHIAFTVTKS